KIPIDTATPTPVPRLGHGSVNKRSIHSATIRQRYLPPSLSIPAGVIRICVHGDRCASRKIPVLDSGVINNWLARITIGDTTSIITFVMVECARITTTGIAGRAFGDLAVHQRIRQAVSNVPKARGMYKGVVLAAPTIIQAQRAGIGPGRTRKHGNWIIPIIVVLFDEGPEGIGPASARKVATKGVFIHVRGHGQLVQVVLAGGTISSLARFLDRRHQETDEYGNNGNHHEQLNQRERFLSRSQKEQHAYPPHKKRQ